jgi:hypothetical protein
MFMWLLAGMLLFSVRLGHFQEKSTPSGQTIFLRQEWTRG